MSYSRQTQMGLAPIRQLNQFIARPDALDTTGTHIHTEWYPEQLYDDAKWYHPWDPALAKHAAMPEYDVFSPQEHDPYTAEIGEQRPASCFSGLSTPGLSYRDSSCSPLSSIDDPGFPPVPNAEAACFSAAVASTSQLLASPPHFSPTSQHLAYPFAGPQEQECSAYMLEPSHPFALPTVDEILACEASWPELLQQESQPAALFSFPGAEALPPHMPPSPSDAEEARQMPELQHPKPWRPFVPSWQTATEFDLAEYVPPQPPSQGSEASHSGDASCQAGPSWVSPSHGQQERIVQVKEEEKDFYLEEEDIEDGCEDEFGMDLEWPSSEDQDVFAEALHALPAHHPYAGGPTATRFGPATLPPISVHRLGHVPQVLPADSLLYQPLHRSVASSEWTSAEPNTYAYAHCP